MIALSTYGLYSLGSYLDYDIDTEKRPMGYTNPAKPDMGADEYNSKGDVNCDANVTAQDALLTLRYVVDNTQTLACPLNGDVAPLTPTGKPIGNGSVELDRCPRDPDAGNGYGDMVGRAIVSSTGWAHPPGQSEGGFPCE